MSVPGTKFGILRSVGTDVLAAPYTTLYVPLLVGTIGISLVVIYYCLENIEKAGARWLLGLQFGFGIVWPGCVLAAIRFAGTDLALFFWRGLYLGLGIGVASFFLFALRYTDHGDLITPRSIALLSIHPVLLALVVATDPYHGLFYSDVIPNPNASLGIGYDLEFGPLFALHTVYSYTVVAAGLVLIGNTAVRSKHLYQRQVLAIAAGILIALFGNAIFLTVEVAGDGMRDLTPVAFGLMGLCFAYAMFRFDLIDMGPAAWSGIVQRLSEGIFVVDTEDRVIDANRACLSFYGFDEDEVIGEPAAEVFSDYPELFERYETVDEARDVVEVSTLNGSRIIDLEVTPLRDHRGDQIGRAFIGRDITDRVRRREKLERKNEQLDQFASFLSHDLRNPLNVAQGTLDLAEETGGSEHFQHARDSLDRMETLIEDVLVMTRQNDAVTDTEPVSIERLACESWANVETAQATIDIRTDEWIDADRNRLLSVFENLFRNAIQHGGTEVTVSVGTARTKATDRSEGERYRLWVADDGPGIPPDDRDKILDGGYTTHDEGTGLGLSIVKNVVTAHGWEIDVTESESGGVRFEIVDIEPQSLVRSRSSPAESE